MAVGRTIYGVVEEHELWPEVAEAIRRYEGWSPRMAGAGAEKRVRQALYGTAPRRFDVQWVLIVIRLVVAHAGPGAADPILGAMHEAEYEGRREHERREDAEGFGGRGEPMRVRRGAGERKVS